MVVPVGQSGHGSKHYTGAQTETGLEIDEAAKVRFVPLLEGLEKRLIAVMQGNSPERGPQGAIRHRNNEDEQMTNQKRDPLPQVPVTGGQLFALLLAACDRPLDMDLRGGFVTVSPPPMQPPERWTNAPHGTTAGYLCTLISGRRGAAW